MQLKENNQHAIYSIKDWVISILNRWKKGLKEGQ